jgi:hypothetical protein
VVSLSEDLARKYLSLPPYLREAIKSLLEYKLDGRKNFITKEDAITIIDKDGMAKGTAKKYLYRLTNPTSEHYCPEFVQEKNGTVKINDESIPSIIFVNKNLLLLLIQVAILSGIIGAFFIFPFPALGTFALGFSVFCILFYRYLKDMVTSKL